MLGTRERLLSLSLTFSAASAKVTFQGRPVARKENRRRLLWVGCGSSIFALERSLPLIYLTLIGARALVLFRTRSTRGELASIPGSQAWNKPFYIVASLLGRAGQAAQLNAAIPVIARPRISACTSCVPS